MGPKSGYLGGGGGKATKARDRWLYGWRKGWEVKQKEKDPRMHAIEPPFCARHSRVDVFLYLNNGYKRGWGRGKGVFSFADTGGPRFISSSVDVLRPVNPTQTRSYPPFWRMKLNLRFATASSIYIYRYYFFRLLRILQCSVRKSSFQPPPSPLNTNCIKLYSSLTSQYLW